MIWLLAGIATLAAVLLLARVIVSVSPGTLLQTIRLAGAAGLLALAGLLVYAKRFGWAFLVGSNAFSLLRGRKRASTQSGRRQARKPQPQMSREEAYQVLGLEAGASEEEIRAAHRRLIAKLHPDKGGGDYLARKINEARDTLLAE